jgi:hypothetical protein
MMTYVEAKLGNALGPPATAKAGPRCWEMLLVYMFMSSLTA